MAVLQRVPKRTGEKSRECDIPEDTGENCLQNYGRIAKLLQMPLTKDLDEKRPLELGNMEIVGT